MSALAPLPIDPLLPQVAASLADAPCAVVVAPPGAGKTTRLPAAMVQAQWSQSGAVAVLQPRRVAARSVAARIAREQGWDLGRQVGYHIRFENRTGPGTRLRVLTEGILTRQIQSDPFLEDVSCVILDEFHERSIHTDLALALLREVQTTVRPDLRIVVMSATMDPAPVARFLGDAPVFESPGRLYEVEMEYLDRLETRPAWELAADGVRRALARPGAGHVLVFLPGMAEIRRTADLIKDTGAQIHRLHSSVSAREQDLALEPTSQRKVILATNIAETSLTIEGVTAVVDTGLVRVARSDPRFGFDRLELRRVSRASADQRAGRAGRTGPGWCLRLWTRGEDAMLEPQLSPEVARLDLAPTLLALRTYGTSDPRRFGWFEPPPERGLEQAEDLLKLLGLVDTKGALTGKGRRVGALPLHPRLGCLLAAGAAQGLLHEAAGLAALLSERDVLNRPAFKHAADSDLLERLDLLDRRGGVEPAGVDPQALEAVRRLREDLLRWGAALTPEKSEKARRPPQGEARHAALLRLPLHAYPDRVTRRRAEDPMRGLMTGGRGVELDPACSVRQGEFFLSLDPRESEPSAAAVYNRAPAQARVARASRIEPAWLGEIFPALVTRRGVHLYDPERQRVVSRRQTFYLDLMLSEDNLSPQDDLAGASVALADYLRGAAGELCAADPAAAAWLARVEFLRGAMPELELPGLAGAALGEALARAARGRWRLDQVTGSGLASLLENELDWPARQALERHAPTVIQVPSGNRIRLQYQGAQGPPVLAVRLQEMFGLAATPRVASGRVAVMLHLLGPNFRPVQITQDLENFWNTTYQEVRRDLRARYPRHPWPENPWTAPPKSIGRPRRG